MVSFADLMVTRKKKSRHKLDAIHELVSWYKVEKKLKQLLKRSPLGPIGYPPLTLFKVLLIQNMYGLSDPLMEEMLYDRISFRDFCGLALSDNVPDETTICRFRGALKGKTEGLFQLVLRDLERKGIALKSGTIVDATVIASAVRPPKGGEVSEKDSEAGWTIKGGEYIHGYKAHVACDATSRIVTGVIATSADVHDSNVLEQLLRGDEPSVMADKAYESKARRARLKAHGIDDQLMYKKKAGKPQPSWQNALNKLWSKRRGLIEGIFGTVKEVVGLRRCRYKGWGKNQTHFELLFMALNLSRGANILRKQGA